MNTIKVACASVTGARHARAGRNGQDAAAVWTGGDAVVAVVCDGCSGGAASEVGARLGAQLVARAVGERIARGEAVTAGATWESARADVVRAIEEIVVRMSGERARVIGDHFLFTIVAAALCGGDAAVWALGDGAYSFGGEVVVLGPFDDNAPPYLGYDLLGEPREAHVAIAPASDVIVIGTDGAIELPEGLGAFAAPRFVEHPDALRRQLAILARPRERIDWVEQRVVRQPAALQDDCAVAVIRRRA